MFQTTSIRASAAKDNKQVGLPFNLNGGLTLLYRDGIGQNLYEKVQRQPAVLPERVYHPKCARAPIPGGMHVPAVY
jgi:hypothetical protein